MYKLNFKHFKYKVNLVILFFKNSLTDPEVVAYLWEGVCLGQCRQKRTKQEFANIVL